MPQAGRERWILAILVVAAVALVGWWQTQEAARAPTERVPLQLPAGGTRLPAPPGRLAVERAPLTGQETPPGRPELNEAVAGTQGWSQLGATFGRPESPTIEVAAGATVAEVGAAGTVCLRGRGGTRTRRIKVILALRLGDTGLEDAEIALEEPAVVPESFVSCLADAVWSLDWPTAPSPVEVSLPLSIGAGGAE